LKSIITIAGEQYVMMDSLTQQQESRATLSVSGRFNDLKESTTYNQIKEIHLNDSVGMTRLILSNFSRYMYNTLYDVCCGKKTTLIARVIKALTTKEHLVGYATLEL